MRARYFAAKSVISTAR